MCIFTVSNALPMSSTTMIVHPAGLFWLKHVATVFILCSAVFVEFLLLKPSCVEMCGTLFVMFGSTVSLMFCYN